MAAFSWKVAVKPVTCVCVCVCVHNVQTLWAIRCGTGQFQNAKTEQCVFSITVLTWNIFQANSDASNARLPVTVYDRQRNPQAEAVEEAAAEECLLLSNESLMLAPEI